MTQCVVQPPREREPVGLEDCGHVLFQCSNCRAYLVDVWVTKKIEGGQTWRGKAKCPYCGDSSFVMEWQGLFAVGGIGSDEQGRLFLPAKGDERTGKDVTKLANFQSDNGILIITVKKVENAEPVYHR